MLESLALNIVASFIGLTGSILVAIFIVEKYLEHQRHQRQEQEILQEAKYQERWQMYIHGGVSVLSAIITHLSLFIAYGRGVYLQLLEARGDTSDVPNSVGEFVPWLINNLQVNRIHPKEGIIPNSTDNIRSQGMGEREAIRLTEAFKDKLSSPITCSRNDLNVLSQYLRSFASHMHDQTLLFQPFRYDG